MESPGRPSSPPWRTEALKDGEGVPLERVAELAALVFETAAGLARPATPAGLPSGRTELSAIRLGRRRRDRERFGQCAQSLLGIPVYLSELLSVAVA